MEVARRLFDVAVSSDSSQRPNIAARLSQPRQKSVPEIVEHERADWLLIVLLRLFVQRFENPFVLLLERGFLDVSILSGSREYPAFVRRSQTFPLCFQHCSDTRSHGKNTPSRRCLTVGDNDGHISAVRPCNRNSRLVQGDRLLLLAKPSGPRQRWRHCRHCAEHCSRCK
jgi:hypothetical protein